MPGRQAGAKRVAEDRGTPTRRNIRRSGMLSSLQPAPSGSETTFYKFPHKPATRPSPRLEQVEGLSSVRILVPNREILVDLAHGHPPPPRGWVLKPHGLSVMCRCGDPRSMNACQPPQHPGDRREPPFNHRQQRGLGATRQQDSEEDQGSSRDERLDGENTSDCFCESEGTSHDPPQSPSPSPPD